MLDDTVSEYYAGVMNNGSVVFVNYLRKNMWGACMASGQYELLNNSGRSSITDDFNLKYVKPILIGELLKIEIFHTKIQWCEKGKMTSYLTRGFSEGRGVNYYIVLNNDFKFIVYIGECQDEISFICDSFQEAQSWCEENVLKEMGYKS